MTYSYPSTIFITYTSPNPNLAVSFLFLRNLSDKKLGSTDTAGDRNYKSPSIIAEQKDGDPNGYTTPLVLARQESLDTQSRGLPYYTYALSLDKLDPGYYTGVIEVREKDTRAQGQYGSEYTPGIVIETVQKEFNIVYSDLDRVLCVGNDHDGNSIHKSIADMIGTTYNYIVSTKSTFIGKGEKDLIISLPNLKDGEIIFLTFKEPKYTIDSALLGNQNESTVVDGKVRFIKTPLGKYILTFQSTGDTNVIEHL